MCSEFKNQIQRRRRFRTSAWPLLRICCILSLCASGVIHAEGRRNAFVVEGDHFELKGRPFQIISGEMHYARVPREYWRARMEMAKAMGLNTLATYVFWNVH